jgi:LPXTG-motif cell wall-anchored protein
MDGGTIALVVVMIGMVALGGLYLARRRQR